LLSMLSTRVVSLPVFFYAFAAHRDLASFPTRALPISFGPDAVPFGADEAVPLGRWGQPVQIVDRDHAASPPKRTPCCSRMITIEDRKSTRLNSSHVKISYAVFCLIKKNLHLKSI